MAELTQNLTVFNVTLSGSYAAKGFKEATELAELYEQLIGWLSGKYLGKEIVENDEERDHVLWRTEQDK